MYRHEGVPNAPRAMLLNAAAAWLFCAIGAWEAAWLVEHAVAGSWSWPAAAGATVPALALFALPRLVASVRWPFMTHRDSYSFIAGMGLALSLGLWSVGSDIAWSGDPSPLPYAPLLNPIDLVQVLVLFVLYRYGRFLDTLPSTTMARLDARAFRSALAVLAFMGLNAVLFRTLHQWFSVAWGIEASFKSTRMQASVSIFWAILALVAMLLAARRQQRVVWLVGASQLGIVVVKLFLVDLSRVGSIERIVSFVGVGVLMLVVGYWSPIPPAVRTPR